MKHATGPGARRCSYIERWYKYYFQVPKRVSYVLVCLCAEIQQTIYTSASLPTGYTVIENKKQRNIITTREEKPKA